MMICADAVPVHPLSSVTVTVYVPSNNPERSSAVEPLLHKYVYGDVPPEAVTLIFPVPSSHSKVSPVAVTLNAAAGCVTYAVSRFEQPFASTTCTG
jgi:hypothetical protein